MILFTNPPTVITALSFAGSLRIFSKKKSLAGHIALDLGCGEGRYSLFLARLGCHTFAIDRSTAGIAKLEKLAHGGNLPVFANVIDIEDFAFKDNQFDIIVAATVLDHLSDELRRRTLGGIKQSLKPGGIVYVNVFTVSDPGYTVRQQLDAEKTGASVSDTAECMEYYFESDELRLAFSDFDILYYYEGLEPDLSHGRPHDHGWACLLARKK